MTATPYVLICSTKQLLEEYWRGFGAGCLVTFVFCALLIITISVIRENH